MRATTLKASGSEVAKMIGYYTGLAEDQLRRDGKSRGPVDYRRLTTAAIMDQEARLISWARRCVGAAASRAAARAVAGVDRLVLVIVLPVPARRQRWPWGWPTWAAGAGRWWAWRRRARPPMYGPDALVFGGSDGGVLRANAWRSRHWRPAVRAAGLEPLRPHDLCHTAVSLWIAVGARPNQIAAWAGHTSVSVVLDR